MDENWSKCFPEAYSEHKKPKTAIFGSANPLNSKILGVSKMVCIDLDYGMDENWPKSFCEVY